MAGAAVALVAAGAALVAVATQARSQGRLRPFLFWAVPPLLALAVGLVPFEVARWSILAALLASGLFVLLVLPRHPRLSGAPLQPRQWARAVLWTAVWTAAVVTATVVR
jgi:hypothetical protein